MNYKHKLLEKYIIAAPDAETLGLVTWIVIDIGNTNLNQRHYFWSLFKRRAEELGNKFLTELIQEPRVSR